MNKLILIGGAIAAVLLLRKKPVVVPYVSTEIYVPEVPQIPVSSSREIPVSSPFQIQESNNSISPDLTTYVPGEMESLMNVIDRRLQANSGVSDVDFSPE